MKTAYPVGNSDYGILIYYSIDGDCETNVPCRLSSMMHDRVMMLRLWSNVTLVVLTGVPSL